jgi:lysophospholipase L1-like esterase
MRFRLLTLLSVACLVVLGAIPASANEGRGDGGDQSYLALGDSVPFGFNPLVNAKDADNFVGYPEIVARSLDLKDVNATCPGEATGGFLSLTGTDNVCRPYRFLLKDPLHVHYKTSQMAYAMSYLRAHKNSTRLVTMTLGANDLFRWQKDCAVGLSVGTCPLGFNGVLAVMQTNLKTIFAKIRATGYEGLIVGVTYYALNYADPVSAGTSLAMALQMTAAVTAYGGVVADGFGAWAPVAATAGGDSCAAGLLIRLSASTCDVHPTPKGRDLLAAAVVKAIASSCAAHSAEECLEKADFN